MKYIQQYQQLEQAVRNRLRALCVDMAIERKHKPVDKEKLEKLKTSRKETDKLLNQISTAIQKNQTDDLEQYNTYYKWYKETDMIC